MALFNKSDKPKIDRSNTTVIAAGTKIKGEIAIECKLHVDGEFVGEIKSESMVTVGKTGLIEGEISAKKLIVTGHFVGNADCEEIEILESGKVAGQVATKVLVIERGSFFEGESKLKTPKPVSVSAANESDPPKAEIPANVTRIPEPQKSRAQGGV